MQEPTDTQPSDEPSARLRFLHRNASDCERCPVRHSALFREVSSSELERLTKDIENFVLRRGSLLYSSGDPGQALFTIRVGLVKLVADDPQGAGRIVRLLGRGAALGLEVLGGSHYTHTAIAMRTTNVCEIPTQTIYELSAHNPRFIFALTDKWEEQVKSADRAITMLCTGSVTQRLAGLVRMTADVSGDCLESIQLPTISEISALIGASPEAVSRHMAELKRAGILTHLAPRHYRCDPAWLADCKL